jgi:hypothetical protein
VHELIQAGIRFNRLAAQAVRAQRRAAADEMEAEPP